MSKQTNGYLKPTPLIRRKKRFRMPADDDTTKISGNNV